MIRERVVGNLARASLIALSFGVAHAGAAPTDAQRCLSARMAAAGVEARSGLACARRALATGDDAACLAAAAARRDAAFARAESRGGCDATGGSAVVGVEVRGLRDGMLAALRPGGPAASGCTAAQLAAVARGVAKLSRSYVRNDRVPGSANPAGTLVEVATELQRDFARAARRGDCLSSTSALQAAEVVRAAMARLRAVLLPTCGDGVRAGSEVCDGGEHDACPATCASDCTCAPPSCGNAVVESGEQCDGASCPDTEPGQFGCSAPGSSSPCQCCALGGPCYVRGFGSVEPVSTPCCSGVCQIPGPEAGPNVVVFCTVPPASCPCWTSASLDATFPAGYFDGSGRGGATCDVPQTVGIAATDTCLLPRPSGGTLEFTRAGAAVLGGASCALFTDLDPTDSGICSQPPFVTGITTAEAAACVAELQASQIYSTGCP